MPGRMPRWTIIRFAVIVCECKSFFFYPSGIVVELFVFDCVVFNTSLRRYTIVNADNIIRFCNQDEYHDPSEEYEEYLTCAVCGDHCTLICGPALPKLLAIVTNLVLPTAHRQCAREQSALNDAQGIFRF